MQRKKPGQHKGHAGYFWTRQRNPAELEWVRASSFEGHSLPRPIVLVNGCFDLLHSSHMKLLFAAREKGETLVCAMDSDRRVRAAKGPHRPVLNWIERATALGYMPIDYLVEIDSDAEMRDLINSLRPDLRVQGSDYIGAASKYPWLRKMFVQSGRINTSEIVRRCREGGVEISND